MLSNALSNSESRLPLPKRLSDTRWSARADAITALHKGYTIIMDVLKTNADDDSTKMEARQQALGLSTCMSRLETGILVVLWEQILQRFQMTSMSLQSSDQVLNTACSLYESLIGYVETLRNSFNEIVEKASNFPSSDQYQDEGNSRRRRKRNQRFDDSDVEGDTLDAMNSSERFRIESYLVITDSLVAALSRRQTAYSKLKQLFGFLRHLTSLTADEIKVKAAQLVDAYPEDIENDIKGEKKINFLNF